MLRPTWQDVGVNVNENPSMEEALAEANADFTVEVVPGRYDWNGQLYTAANNFYVIRTDTGAVLGTCKGRFKPVQNHEAFAFTQMFVDEGLCTLDSIGVIGGGEKIWVVTKFAKSPAIIIGEDTIQQYLLIINAHDGSSSVCVGIITLRLWCSNMLAGLSKNMIRFKHTQNVGEMMQFFRSMLAIELEKTQHYVEILRTMANTKLSDPKAYIRKVFSACSANKLAIIMQSPIVTVYDGFNAITQYLTHTSGRSAESRFRSNILGANVKINQLAYEKAVLLC